jgi:hypothetical protein
MEPRNAKGLLTGQAHDDPQSIGDVHVRLSHPRQRTRPHRRRVVRESMPRQRVLGHLYGPEDGKTFEGVIGKEILLFATRSVLRVRIGTQRLACVVGFAGLWLMTSRCFPHRDADPVPGAIAVGIGVGIPQVVAAYLLGPYALEKQGTYGALGLAATLLFGLWAVGRLLIGAAAEINATLWERTRRETT